MAIRTRQAIIRSLLFLPVLLVVYHVLNTRGGSSFRQHREILPKSDIIRVFRPPDDSIYAPATNTRVLRPLNDSIFAPTPRLPNNASDITPRKATEDCIIRVVVRGHHVFFSDVIPSNRVTWCSHVGCTVSLVYSSNLSDILAANITFFSHLHRSPPLRDVRYLVENRRDNQRFALMSLETPLRVARNTTLPSSFGRTFYNWLATYNPASDIPITYGQMTPILPRDPSPKIGNPFKEKSNMIAFVSSNCIHAKWPRLEFVHELQKYLPVDMYGKCGNLTCGSDDNCTDILRQYKFILALENSPCKGYISEKFWRAISDYRSVAVVFGADLDDYDRYTPPGSFIFIESFRSIEDLAAHIKEVSSDEELYNNFHRWRKNYRVQLQNDWEELPDDEQLCNAAERYVTELGTKRFPTFKDTNRRDWIGSCRIKVHTKMEGFPIKR